MTNKVLQARFDGYYAGYHGHDRKPSGTLAMRVAYNRGWWQGFEMRQAALDKALRKV